MYPHVVFINSRLEFCLGESQGPRSKDFPDELGYRKNTLTDYWSVFESAPTSRCVMMISFISLTDCGDTVAFLYVVFDDTHV